MRKVIIIPVLLLALQFLSAQENITIENFQSLARENYPVIKRYGLIEKTREYNVSNAGRGYLPQ